MRNGPLRQQSPVTELKEEDRIPAARTFDTLVQSMFESVEAQKASTVSQEKLTKSIRVFGAIVVLAILVTLTLSLMELGAIRDINHRIERLEKKVFVG